MSAGSPSAAGTPFERPRRPRPVAPGGAVETASGTRPWHRVWPPHLGLTLDYPDVPAWWLLERSLARFGARAAVLELDPATLAERRALTYATLWRAARGAAAGLAGRGVGPGTRVGYCLPNGVDLVTGYYATWVAGGAVVPANPLARESELTRQLGDAAVSLVVGEVGSAAARAATALGVDFVDLAAFRALADRPPAEPAPCVPAQDVAVILYTGGTTGTSKGAMLSHRNVVVNTIQFAEWYGFAPGEETVVSAIPMYHSGGMSGVMNVPLYAAATLLVFDRFSASAVARAVSRHRVTRLFGVPTMFIALLDDAEGRRADYAALRACRTNAAPLPPAVKRAFDELVGRDVLVEGYGLTETSPLTHANPIGRAKLGSIGVPLPDTDARIVDDDGDDVKPGQAGELLIRGPQVMLGYWGRPDETATVLSAGWLRTGDVATMDAEGYFAIVDRRKDVINTAGFKVWPREIEETLLLHPGVRQVGVVGVPDDYRGEAVKAFVVLRDGAGPPPSAEEIIEFCRERITPYKVPRMVEFRRELPMTATGKLLRRELREDMRPRP